MSVTVHDVRAFKERGERFAMLTAYDALSARLLDEAGIPLLLVGDSLGMVVLGYDSTLPVTMDDMVHHTAAVVRGRRDAMVIGDMPFMSYQASDDEAIHNAGRLMQEAGAHAVKLEGGARIVDIVARLTDMGVPVMGHLGLTPQSVHALGGYRVQGRDEAAAARLAEDARKLESAGACAIVLELIPAALAGRISSSLTIPTIGIGAGPQCDGQVLVLHDMLGLNEQFAPKFLKHYAQLGQAVREAVRAFAGDVRDGKYPGKEHSFD